MDPSINQLNPNPTENQNILEQTASVTANESPVEIHLENTTHAVKTVEMEVCDVDDYLTLSTCVTTDRTAGFYESKGVFQRLLQCNTIFYAIQWYYCRRKWTYITFELPRFRRSPYR